MNKFQDEDKEVFTKWASEYLQAKWVQRGITISAYKTLMRALDLAKSPIERRLLAGLIFCPFGVYDEINEVATGMPESVPDATPFDRALIIPQFHIEKLKWHVDFLVSLGPILEEHKPPIFVIECDRHDFHERTKEQAARDRKRDRDIQRLGYPILRFTGSEIFRDLEGCLKQIETFGYQLLDKVWEPWNQ